MNAPLPWPAVLCKQTSRWMRIRDHCWKKITHVDVWVIWSFLCMKDSVLCWGNKSRNKLKRNWGMDEVRDSGFQRCRTCVLFYLVTQIQIHWMQIALLLSLPRSNDLGPLPRLSAFQRVLPSPRKTVAMIFLFGPAGRKESIYIQCPYRFLSHDNFVYCLYPQGSKCP